MVIADTTVWIDYLRGTRNPQADWLHDQMSTRRVGLTDLILCEVLQGVSDPVAFSQLQDEFPRRFYVFETGGIELAIAAARNYRTLRDRGHTVRKTIDCLIATFCIELGHELLHRDHDYDAFEKFLGLQVISP